MSNEHHQYQFKNIDGSLHYCQGDRIIYGPTVNEELSFALDVGSGDLRKHGSSSSVDKWVKSVRKTIKDACRPSKSSFNPLNPFNDPLEDIVIVTVSAPFQGEGAWDVELINKFVQNSGFIGLWYKQMLAEQEQSSLANDEGMPL